MRINRDVLIRLAKQTAERISRNDRSLLSIYLTGSVLQDDPLLGGTTDIDLICVHDRPPAVSRELQRLSNEVHLDILHLVKNAYDPPRRLRRDPWLGTYLVEQALQLYDRLHWFEFTQASATAQFYLPENTLARCRWFYEPARRAWLDMQVKTGVSNPERVLAYCDTLSNAANTLICLSSPPLSVRRLMVEFPRRALAAGVPELTGDLVNLYTPQEFDLSAWEEWMHACRQALDACSGEKDASLEIVPCRRAYWLNAANALVNDMPAAAIWILLNTWTRAVAGLPASSEERKAWQKFIAALNLDKNHHQEHIEALDALLDRLDETLENWELRAG